MNVVELERTLADISVYFNRSRVHSSPNGDTPAEASRDFAIPRAELHDFRRQTCCRGRYQLPVAARLSIRQAQALKKHPNTAADALVLEADYGPAPDRATLDEA